MKHPLEPRTASVLTRLAVRHPKLKLQFIVTLAPGAKAADVVPFVATQEIEVIRMVAGEMTARQVLDLAAHPMVECIEYDGLAEALDAFADGG
ncbi:hypothetical protein LJR290_002665 [Variovorax sp. LjRoot290]|uniref:hypothetical protein n=1 Tax=unclassified Variovorax TaxID=663243 RepID=UPI003ECC8B5C